MAIALVTKTAAASSDSLNVTTGAINTTGANLLLLWLSTAAAGSSPDPTDSKGNSWTALTAENVGGGERGVWYYSIPTTVGSGHTFSWSIDGSGANAPAICVLAFSGVKATSPFDQQTGSSTFPNNLQPGSQEPSEDNCLVVQGISFNTSATVSIDESYNFAGDGTDYADVSANNKGAAVAYKIQTTAAATNPTWTLSGSSSIAGRSASFKAASGGDVTPPTLSSPATNTDGDEITATLSESGCTADGGGSSGSGGFTLSGTSATVSGWAISGTTLTLTLSGTIYDTDTVTYSYARASTTDDIKDAAGNYLADFSGVSVTNNSTEPSPDVTPPTASSWASNTAGTQITATLSESGCTADGGGSSGTGGFTLTGCPATVSGWSISGTTLTLSLTNLIYQGEVVTVAYSRAGTTDDIKDAAGNYLANISATSVTNNSTQTGGSGVGGSFVGSAYVN